MISTAPCSSIAIACVEDRLLLAALRRHDSRLAETLSAILQEPVDWRYLLAQADRHGVVPLLHASLQQARVALPEAVQSYFRQASMFIAPRNLALTSELVRILAKFESAGIPAMPFKGPVLAVQAYGNLSLRSFCDLDLLLHRKDLRRATALLTEIGYSSEIDLDDASANAYLQDECALQMKGPRETIVELHWSLVEREFSCPIPTEELWARAGTVALAGRKTPCLSPEDLFLYLCLHGAKHQWERLEWICSLAELMQGSHELDWGAILRRAKRWRVVRLLNLALCLIEDLLGVPHPAGCHIDSEAKGLAAQIGQALFARDVPALSSQKRRAAHYRFLVRSRERLEDKLKLLLYSAVRTPHPSSRELITLPQSLHFLYYVVRPLRLAGQYGSLMWRSRSK